MLRGVLLTVLVLSIGHCSDMKDMKNLVKKVLGDFIESSRNSEDVTKKDVGGEL